LSFFNKVHIFLNKCAVCTVSYIFGLHACAVRHRSNFVFSVSWAFEFVEEARWLTFWYVRFILLCLNLWWLCAIWA